MNKKEKRKVKEIDRKGSILVMGCTNETQEMLYLKVLPKTIQLQPKK